MATKTAWYPGTVKPARVGVYERKLFGGLHFSCWDGQQWKLGQRGSITLAADCWLQSGYQSVPWRGLAEKP